MENMYMIKTEGLSKKFKDRQIISDINIRLKKGDIYGLLGLNGAGKMIYISMLFTALLVSINYLASRLLVSQGSEATQELAEEIQLMSSQEYIVNSLGNLVAGGALFIIVTIITSTLITEDYGRGTLKYSLLFHHY